MNIHPPKAVMVQHPAHMRLAPIALGAKLTIVLSRAAKASAPAAMTSPAKGAGESGDEGDCASAPTSGSQVAEVRKELSTTAADSPITAREMKPGDPDLPAFARESLKDDSIVPTTTRLVMFRAASDEGERPVRVVKRSACKAAWYEVEAYFQPPGRWVSHSNTPERNVAIGALRNGPWTLDAEEERAAG